MSDFSPFRSSGAAELPPATVYDPADDHSTPFGGESTGTVVLLLVGEAERSWAAETAVELSTDWARHGRRIVLADLHLENPYLHELVGAPNLEGMVDVFQYGASIARSARPIKGRGFYFIPAGTYTPDVEAVYRHSRWPKLVAGFRDAGASLVLFAPSATADLEAVSQWVDQVILLGPPRDPAVLAPLSAGGADIRGLVVSPNADPVEPPHREPVGRAPAASVPAASPAPLLDAREELHLPPPPVRAPHRGSRAMVVFLFLLLLVATLATVGFLVARLRPDLVPWARVASAPGSDSVRIAAPGTPPPAPRRLGDPLPYSVQVIAYPSLSPARDKLAALRDRFSDVLFFVSPEDLQGVIYYKVMAGALADTTAARALGERLVASGEVNKEDASDWSLIRETGQAFDLGERATRDAAAALADSLLDGQIPAYPIQVLYSDSSRRWQLYGGAYPDSASADAMRMIIVEAGLQPRLVPRVGRPSTTPE